MNHHVDYNFLPSLISPFLPEEVTLVDVTLRDGEQQMEAAFSHRDKVETVHDLVEAGIRRIQVGFAEGDADTVADLSKDRLPVEYELYVTASASSWKENVDRALEAGADVIHLFIRSKDEVLSAMGLDRSFVLERVAASVSYAKSQGGREVAFGTTHFTQSDLGFVHEIYAAAEAAGATEFVLNDSLGLTKPAAMAYLVASVKRGTTLPVRVHCHNDYGLAVACSLASIEAGATRVDVCVNGLGERAGNAPLEEVAMGAERLLGVKTGVHLSRLTSLSASLAKRLNMEVPSNKAVVGANAFAQKLDIHVEVAKDRPHLFEPYGPEVVGGKRAIRLGKSSGPFAVRHKLRELGFMEEAENTKLVVDLVEWVNQYAETHKTYVDDTSFQYQAKTISRLH